MFNGDRFRIVIYSVDLLSVAKPFFNALHSRQPFQGFLADIKSLNIENHLEYVTRSRKRNRVS